MTGMVLVGAFGGPKVPILGIRPRTEVSGLLTVDIPPRVQGNFARVKDSDVEPVLKKLLKEDRIDLVNFHMSYPELTSKGLTGVAQATLEKGEIKFYFEKSEKTDREIMAESGEKVEEARTVPSWEDINLSEYALAIDKNTRVVIFIEKDNVSDKIPFVTKEDLFRKE